MKTCKFLCSFITYSFLVGSLIAQSQSPLTFEKLETKVDNLGYWKAAAEHGLTVPNPQRSVPPAVFTGSEIRAITVITDDSPDVVIISGNTGQSENSVFLDPNDDSNPINSNNSTSQPGSNLIFYGADYLYSTDGGVTWGGSMQGAGISNSGDPTTAIGLNGRNFVGFINNSSGQSLSYSDNQGANWTAVMIASGGGALLDKNHLWIDNSPSSPYEGNLYDAWTPFGGGDNYQIDFSRSTDDGATWSTPQRISNGASAYFCHGVNIQTGPNGEVYAAFCIYDNWPSDEDAIGLARSFDGGETWTASRAIINIRGIRNTTAGKGVRANSFPVMAADISNGPYRGNLYITWTNVGVPGVNTGNDVDVYMIRSEDNGETWSTPIRVNQDPIGQGKKHYFGWITCDPATGTLSMVWYDDREVSSNLVEVYCGNSTDAGNTWEDFKVSDVSFDPTPIPGLADQYFGDYIGITAKNGKVYPVWTDNRTGTALAYTSPYTTSVVFAPTNLVADLDQETGIVDLTWTHEPGPLFDHYNIYRGLIFVGTSFLPFYTDTLPDYGSYRYYVTAYYPNEGESAPAVTDVQWGNAQAQIAPDSVVAYVLPEESTSVIMGLSNVGELPLEYQSNFSLPSGQPRDTRAYCTGSGGCGESILGVTYGDVTNFSGCNGYEDFTNLSNLVTKGASFDITVQNSTNIYPEDVCGIWIDWNQNESFLDDAPVSVNGSPGAGPYTATITVPDNAKNGMTRLRIRIKRGGFLSACGTATTGEVEDYSVNVLGWVTASPLAATVQPGESQDITFDFDATGLQLGTYNANFNINSNDPDNGQIVVPVTLHVTDITATVTADKDSLCLGGSTTLHAIVSGGSGTYTYSWTSDPEGFTSTEANPQVTPAITTTYFVEVTDGDITIGDDITITVFNLPAIDLGPDITECEGEQVSLDAGAGFASYLWSNGQTSQSITVTNPGIYWVVVVNDFGCANSDSVVFSTNPLPLVDLGADQNLCEGTQVMLFAGTGFETCLWNTGETTYYINAGTAGEYWVEVTDGNGCSNRDTIVLTGVPQPSIDLGADQSFCEGSFILLEAGSGFTSYLWSTGETGPEENVSQPGEYWVEVTDANGCSNRDTILVTMDPLPVTPSVTSGPTSVDNFLNPVSDFTSSASTYATSYEWALDPAEAGTISGTGTSGQVTWSSGYAGTAHISVKGMNDCGGSNYSPLYDVNVYSSQGISEKNAVTGIKLYPNPNDGIFTLQLYSAREQDIRIKISTSGGNQILESKESIGAGLYQKNFNLSSLPGGTYYLVLSDSNGRMLSRQQVVVH